MTADIERQYAETFHAQLTGNPDAVFREGYVSFGRELERVLDWQIDDSNYWLAVAGFGHLDSTENLSSIVCGVEPGKKLHRRQVDDLETKLGSSFEGYWSMYLWKNIVPAPTNYTAFCSPYIDDKPLALDSFERTIKYMPSIAFVHLDGVHATFLNDGPRYEKLLDSSF